MKLLTFLVFLILLVLIWPSVKLEFYKAQCANGDRQACIAGLMLLGAK